MCTAANNRFRTLFLRHSPDFREVSLLRLFAIECTRFLLVGAFYLWFQSSVKPRKYNLFSKKHSGYFARNNKDRPTIWSELHNQLIVCLKLQVFNRDEIRVFSIRLHLVGLRDEVRLQR